MPSVHYQAPTTLAQAVQILHGASDARVLAGGTDLMVQMKLGLRRPGNIVDIKRIPELMECSLNDRGLRLGAAVPGHMRLTEKSWNCSVEATPRLT